MSSWLVPDGIEFASETQRDLVKRVEMLLDELSPARLKPSEQRVVYEPTHAQTWIELRHDSDPVLEIRLVVTDDWANFYGVIGHDEAYDDSSDIDSAGAWKSEAIDILRDLLTAEYDIRSYTLNGRAWRDVVSIGEPVNLKFVEGSPFSFLPLQRLAKLSSSRLSTFECRGERDRRMAPGAI